MKDILQTTEHDKVRLMVKTLKPTIALNLAFDQGIEVQKILKTILKEKNIISVEIQSENYNRKLVKKELHKVKQHTYVTTVKDPFNSKSIATISISHSYHYLITLYDKIAKILIIIFLFALLVFLTFYIAMKKELNDLRAIAGAFHNYSKTKQLTFIDTQSKTTEIRTIAHTANKMIKNIATYLEELKLFNTDLEKQVEEKVQKLRSQEKMIIHQSRQAAMGEMLESIAHQWRQPLNIIGLSCANLEMEHDLGVQNDKNFKDKMQIIASNINYMSNTIDDFRDFLNPDREASFFNPETTIKEVYHILAAQLENNHIELTIHSNMQLELYGIENEFKQVVFILINNSKDAIKSLQKNVPDLKGKIEVKLWQKLKTNNISFCDNGGGIKEDIIHSIFDPYFTTKFASAGTGIGLYIAKNIIATRMKGEIKAVNIKDGCCMNITQDKDAKDKE